MLKKSTGPSYDLAHLQQLIGKSDTRIITRTAYLEAAALGYAGAADIVAVIKQINPQDFFKTMPAHKAPGRWQDVYRIWANGVELYVKLQLSVNGKGVVIQFKRK